MYIMGLTLKTAKLLNLHFYPLEVVSRYRDPQLQLTENYSYLFNFSTNICKSWWWDTHFIPNYNDLVHQQNKLKSTIIAISRIRVNWIWCRDNECGAFLVTHNIRKKIFHINSELFAFYYSLIWRLHLHQRFQFSIVWKIFMNDCHLPYWITLLIMNLPQTI